MAASLSVAGVGKFSIGSLRAATRILDNANFRLVERSELAGEMATLELASGGERKARELFRRSLGTPTDNSLAQVQWASDKLPSLALQLENVEIPFVAEALSRAAYQQGDWKSALFHAIRWIDDQPFDTQAATTASYIAAVGLEDWDTSVIAAEMGLRAKPHDPLLTNNLAYALVERGDLTRAAEYLTIDRVRAAEKAERVALDATRGLLKFRLGNRDEGRALYGKAIEFARRSGEADAEAMARSMLIREELRHGGVTQIEALIAALDKVRGDVHDAGVLQSIRRAKEIARQAGFRVDADRR
ncbi:MAG: hypothetical protein M3083_00935 [Actinomycetota bacterium]|nr:hypothetical protein [Actinomycetota bacterium]MDQ6946403.1 hypothetical protein [Actinomycetota bacterium]